MVRLPKTEQKVEGYLVSLGDNVKSLRLKCGLSQQSLAESVGISYPRISEIERGRGNPTVRTLQAIADVLDVPIERLFKGSKKTSAVA